MFGMGFMEIFLIAVVAIIALGPEKLPSAMVDIAKFFKKFKSGLDEAKSTINNELNISEMKAEAEKFKASVADVKGLTSLDMQDLSLDERPEQNEKIKTEAKPEVKTNPEINVKKETVSLKEETKA